MDHMSDELCREYGKCVLGNYESRPQEQSLGVTQTVGVETAASVKSRIQTQPPFDVENGHSHFPKWFNHEYPKSSANEFSVGQLTRSQTLPALQPMPSTISTRRGINLNLVPFDGLPKSSAVDTDEVTSSNLDTGRSDESNQSEALTRVSSFPVTMRSSSVGPPTPPLEADLSSWLIQAPATGFARRSIGSSGTTVPVHQAPVSGMNYMSQQVASTTSTREISNLNFAGTPWFQTVLGLTCATMDADTSTHSIKVISQILPMNASDQRTVKTYEMICDRIQQISREPRSITITHARKISPGQVVEDFPKSPPATPYHTGGDSYFGDQTIFTHVAEVPVHHDLRYASQGIETTAQRHIMTAEASSIVLERYIPPTTADETLDLFDANSCRSYLADRLPELAPSVGSLIFIYPTKTGAQTFARRYVGPVLDPLLREMSILKGLNTNAAERLGRMRSIDSMFEFKEMQEKLQNLCDSMNSRIAFQRTRTEFRIEHSDTAHIVLDRDTWMTWFVEQEQMRMKQDLVDYHREGGILPDTENVNTEVTAGMLSREVTDGLRKSTRIAGEVGVEVGVFVIRRHRKRTIS